MECFSALLHLCPTPFSTSVRGEPNGRRQNDSAYISGYIGINIKTYFSGKREIWMCLPPNMLKLHYRVKSLCEVWVCQVPSISKHDVNVTMV